MELVGKCKIDFENYVMNKRGIDPRAKNFLNNTLSFHQLPLSMQYGMLVDFFDSVDICIIDGYYPFLFGGHTYAFAVRDKSKKHSVEESFNTRNEARTEAILKAMEIHNNNKK